CAPRRAGQRWLLRWRRARRWASALRPREAPARARLRNRGARTLWVDPVLNARESETCRSWGPTNPLGCLHAGSAEPRALEANPAAQPSQLRGIPKGGLTSRGGLPIIRSASPERVPRVLCGSASDLRIRRAAFSIALSLVVEEILCKLRL